VLLNNLPKAIIFFGPDGSGKSTQADLLIRELNVRKIRNKKIWIRSLHTLAFLISKVAMHTLRLSHIYELRSRYANNSFFRTTWSFIEFISILIPIILKFSVPIRQGYVMVAERFVIDWIVSLAFALDQHSLVNGRLANQALHFIPKNSLLVYIDANYDAIAMRRPIEDSHEFIEFQRSCYSKFAKELHALTIDSSDKNIDEVYALIRNSIFQDYPQSHGHDRRKYHL